MPFLATKMILIMTQRAGAAHMRRRVDAAHLQLQRLRGMTLEETQIATAIIRKIKIAMTIRVNFPGTELTLD